MVTFATLRDRYDLFLLDAYGVIVHAGGAMPGAIELFGSIEAADKSFRVVTNDASKLPETAALRYQGLGLPVEAKDIVSSGMLLEPAFARLGLRGARTLVLGPTDSEEYVRRAGGTIESPREDGVYDAVVVCDDAGYPFLNTLDVVLTALIRLFDRGQRPTLILPNPDIVYPKSESSYGFTAGAAAMLLEEALGRRYRDDPPVFERLGKPEPTIFEAAMAGADPQRTLMVGDQLETDIAGAAAAGIDSMLVESGVSGQVRGSVEPTLRVPRLVDLTR